MKTMKKEGVIKRVTDQQADLMIKTGWKFCPKSEFKTSKESKK